MALIGAGRMGRAHLRALSESPAVRVVAIVEPVAAIRAVLKGTGIPTHRTVDEIVGRRDIDAALICAPSDLHLVLVRALASAKLAILCEKPCGLTAVEATEAARAAETAGVTLQIGYWRRFVPALIELRARMACGGLGEISFVSCWQWDEVPPSAAFRQRSGGILIDMGVHEFDQLRWLTGQEIEDVVAIPAGVVSEPPVPNDPETLSALVRLSGGAVGALSLGRRFVHGDCCWVEAFGTAGHARSLFQWGDTGAKAFLDALAGQAEAFARTVIDGAPQCGATAADAIAALRAAELARRGAVDPGTTA